MFRFYVNFNVTVNNLTHRKLISPNNLIPAVILLFLNAVLFSRKNYMNLKYFIKLKIRRFKTFYKVTPCRL